MAVPAERTPPAKVSGLARVVAAALTKNAPPSTRMVARLAAPTEPRAVPLRSSSEPAETTKSEVAPGLKAAAAGSVSTTRPAPVLVTSAAPCNAPKESTEPASTTDQV